MDNFKTLIRFAVERENIREKRLIQTDNFKYHGPLEHVTLFCSRLHRGVFGSFARAIFSHDRPGGEIRSWLEPHGLLHQKLPGDHMATAFCYML